MHRDVAPGLPWFIGCLAATIVAANVRLHLRFSAAVLPQELAVAAGKTRGWVALADWALVLLWAYAGASLMASEPRVGGGVLRLRDRRRAGRRPDRAGDHAGGLQPRRRRLPER